MVAEAAKETEAPSPEGPVEANDASTGLPARGLFHPPHPARHSPTMCPADGETERKTSDALVMAPTFRSDSFPFDPTFDPSDGICRSEYFDIPPGLNRRRLPQ